MRNACAQDLGSPGRSGGVRAWLRVLVAALDEQPLRSRARAGALEREAAAQALAVQDEDGVAALERLGPGDAAALLVGALVPDPRLGGSRRQLDREALVGRVHRRALRHRPRADRAVDLQLQREAALALAHREA